jgi:peptidoglycan/LPS O-acetylase OafA/YrhL
MDRSVSTSTTSSAKSGALHAYIPTLDGWRSIAILMVLACHARDRLFGIHGILPIAPLDSVLVHGVLGVDVFFGLSGFLITSKLLEEYRQNGAIDLRDFYWRRFFRIFPAAWAYLAIVFVCGLAGVIVVAPHEIQSCLLFWRNYDETLGWYTGQFWSLVVEEHFYLLWPAALVILAPRRARPAAALAALTIALWRNWHAATLFMANIFPKSFPEHRTDTRLDSLLWGCVAALILPQLSRMLLRIKFGSMLPIVFASLLVLLGLLKESGFAASIQSISRPMLIPLMIVSTVVYPNGLIGRFLEVPSMRFVGKISYSLYVWQQPFFILDSAALSGLHVWQYWPAAPLGLAACALASYYFVERPMIRLGSNLRRGRQRKIRMAMPASVTSA